MSDRGTTPSRKDPLLSALADRQCRRVVDYLGAADDDVSLDELVDHLTGHHRSDRAERVQLHHVTLPKLAAAGVVSYDWEANVVRTQATGDFGELLDGIGPD